MACRAYFLEGRRQQMVLGFRFRVEGLGFKV